MDSLYIISSRSGRLLYHRRFVPSSSSLSSPSLVQDPLIFSSYLSALVPQLKQLYSQINPSTADTASSSSSSPASSVPPFLHSVSPYSFPNTPLNTALPLQFITRIPLPNSSSLNTTASSSSSSLQCYPSYSYEFSYSEDYELIACSIVQHTIRQTLVSFNRYQNNNSTSLIASLAQSLSSHHDSSSPSPSLTDSILHAFISQYSNELHTPERPFIAPTKLFTQFHQKSLHFLFDSITQRLLDTIQHTFQSYLFPSYPSSTSANTNNTAPSRTSFIFSGYSPDFSLAMNQDVMEPLEQRQRGQRPKKFPWKLSKSIFAKWVGACFGSGANSSNGHSRGNGASSYHCYPGVDQFGAPSIQHSLWIHTLTQTPTRAAADDSHGPASEDRMTPNPDLDSIPAQLMREIEARLSSPTLPSISADQRNTLLSAFFQAGRLMALVQDQANFFSLKIVPKRKKQSNNTGLQPFHLLIYRIGHFFLGFPVYPPDPSQAPAAAPDSSSSSASAASPYPFLSTSPFALHSLCWRTFASDPTVHAVANWCQFLWENEEFERRKEEKKKKKQQSQAQSAAPQKGKAAIA